MSDLNPGEYREDPNLLNHFLREGYESYNIRKYHDDRDKSTEDPTRDGIEEEYLYESDEEDDERVDPRTMFDVFYNEISGFVSDFSNAGKKSFYIKLNNAYEEQTDQTLLNKIIAAELETRLFFEGHLDLKYCIDDLAKLTFEKIKTFYTFEQSKNPTLKQVIFAENELYFYIIGFFNVLNERIMKIREIDKRKPIIDDIHLSILNPIIDLMNEFRNNL